MTRHRNTRWGALALVAFAGHAAADHDHHWTCGTVEPVVEQGTWRDRLWPDGIVPIAFAPDITPAERAAFEQGADFVEDGCGILLVTRTDETDYILVTRSTDPGVSYSTSIGRQGGEQRLLIWDSHWTSTGLISHELMHALGLYHEQSRPDRDDYITVEWSHIRPGYEGNFGMAGLAHGPYDFDSVMHYHACAFSTCGSCSPADAACRTISVKPAYAGYQGTIGAASSPSAGDDAVLTMMYGPALRPNADNRSGRILARIGSNDPIENGYNVTPSDEFDSIDLDMVVSSGDIGIDEYATARVVTESEYVGYDDFPFRFEEIRFTSHTEATMFVGFEEGEVLAQDNVRMGFTIGDLDPGQLVGVRFLANVRTTGDVDDAFIEFSGPGIFLRVTDHYDHILWLGPGEYSLEGIADVGFSANADFLGEGAVDLSATIGRADRVDVPPVIAGPIMHDGHAYLLLDDSNWTQSQQVASSSYLSDLVTYDTLAEAQFVTGPLARFDDTARHTWTGLTDRYSEGDYQWVSGLAGGFQSWINGEPNGGIAQSFAAMWMGSTSFFDAEDDWNDRFAPVFGVVEVETPDVVAGPFYRDGHTYYLLDDADWRASDVAARAMGGHLVTMNDASEANWVRQNVVEFDGAQRHAWLGLTDQYREGAFAWTNGEDPGYASWISGEPNGSYNENHVAMWMGTTLWFDGRPDWNERVAPVFGIVEIPEGPACDADIVEPWGQPDIFDLLEFLGRFESQDPGADVNGDTIFDIFDVLGYLDLFQNC